MIGIDIVEVERIKNIYQKHGLPFLEKLLDRQEINELPTERSSCFFRKLSCYIASKEAIYKACFDQDLGWKDIIIRNIAETPIIYIKKSDVTHKIKLAYTIDKEVVISQALMIRPDEALVPVSLCHGASTPQPHPGPPLVMSEKIDA
jgi:phosphopantetheinyl transferase (holo-ACP synthase)